MREYATLVIKYESQPFILVWNYLLNNPKYKWRWDSYGASGTCISYFTSSDIFQNRWAMQWGYDINIYQYLVWSADANQQGLVVVLVKLIQIMVSTALSLTHFWKTSRTCWCRQWCASVVSSRYNSYMNLDMSWCKTRISIQHSGHLINHFPSWLVTMTDLQPRMSYTIWLFVDKRRCFKPHTVKEDRDYGSVLLKKCRGQNIGWHPTVVKQKKLDSIIF